jgi:hypothetical protein
MRHLEGLDVQYFYLTFGGKPLEDGRVLSFYGIRQGSTLLIHLHGLLGGSGKPPAQPARSNKYKHINETEAIAFSLVDEVFLENGKLQQHAEFASSDAIFVGENNNLHSTLGLQFKSSTSSYHRGESPTVTFNHIVNVSYKGLLMICVAVDFDYVIVYPYGDEAFSHLKTCLYISNFVDSKYSTYQMHRRDLPLFLQKLYDSRRNNITSITSSITITNPVPCTKTTRSRKISTSSPI